jgi:hypothetical protein
MGPEPSILLIAKSYSVEAGGGVMENVSELFTAKLLREFEIAVPHFGVR